MVKDIIVKIAVSSDSHWELSIFKPRKGPKSEVNDAPLSES